MKARSSIGKGRYAILGQLFFIVRLADVHPAYAGCDLELTVHNNFDAPINITTIKTAQTLPFPGTLKEQWTGTVRILSDGYHTFKFTVDAACTYEAPFYGPVLPGVAQLWTVKFFRSNGQICTYNQVPKTSSLAMNKNKCE
jgi:hypothetical protein